jgi:hypothetical protein
LDCLHLIINSAARSCRHVRFDEVYRLPLITAFYCWLHCIYASSDSR